MRDNIILDVEQVIELENRIKEDGTPLYDLMKRAGKALSDEAIAELDARNEDGTVVVFCGNGNNGGDGWVAIEEMAKDYVDMLAISEKWSSDYTTEPAKFAVKSAYDNSQPYMRLYINPEKEDIAAMLKRSEVIVDALLGTGFSHTAVKEPFASWIDAINEAKEAGVYVISCDVPSGMNAQTGEVADHVVKADKTVTMMCNKTGLAKLESAEYTGEIVVAEIADIEKYL